MGKIEWYSREDSYTNDYAPTAKISAISENTTVAPDCRIAFFTGQMVVLMKNVLTQVVEWASAQVCPPRN